MYHNAGPLCLDKTVYCMNAHTPLFSDQTKLPILKQIENCFQIDPMRQIRYLAGLKLKHIQMW